MKARRATLVVALAALVCLLPATAAHATVRASVVEPAADAVLTGAVTVRTPYDAFQCPRWAQVRALVDGDEVTRVGLAPQNGCDLAGGTRTWTGTLDLTAFSCNGRSELQAIAEHMSQWGPTRSVVVQRAPSAPSAVTVTTEAGRATISWQAPPEPDITGYAVERRAGGAWSVIAEPAAGSTSVTDSSAPTGSVDYRVVAFRGDGTVDGAPEEACKDGGRDLKATSSTTTATVPKPTPTPSGSETEGTEGPTEGATDRPTRGGTAGPTEGSGGTPTEDDDEEEAAQRPAPRPSPSSTRSSARVSPPSSVATGSRPDVDVPDVAAGEPERYYGDDLGYSDEIDYGDLGSVQAGDDLSDQTVQVRIPGGLQGILGETLALQRVLTPVAGGMIMLSFGLHLRRWTRAGLVKH